MLVPIFRKQKHQGHSVNWRNHERYVLLNFFGAAQAQGSVFLSEARQAIHQNPRKLKCNSSEPN